MNTLKRTVVKLALVGALAGSIVGMPGGASAAPNAASNGNTCFGYVFTAQYAKEGITPKVKADFYEYNNAGEFNESLRTLCGQ